MLAKKFNVGTLECNQEWPTHPIKVYPMATQGIAMRGFEQNIPVKTRNTLKEKMRNSLK